MPNDYICRVTEGNTGTESPHSRAWPFPSHTWDKASPG